jgi:hypothetical protein
MVRIYKPKTPDLPERYVRGFIDKMDGRTDLAQRLQIAYQEICEDIGGEEDQTHLKLSLVERAVFLEFCLQKWEREILLDKATPDQIGKWIQATNSLLGLAKTLGLTRARIQGAIDSLYKE